MFPIAVLACGSGSGSSFNTTSASNLDVNALEETEDALSQMNDVSVLYALAKTHADLDAYLKLSSPGVGGPLLPKAIFDGMGGDMDPDEMYDNFRMTAFRIDPCSTNIGPVKDPSTCRNQLRLIFQSVTIDHGAADSGVHLFYSLTRDELMHLLRSIINLRRSNGDHMISEALTVHPLIRKQGLTGTFASGLNKLILKYAGETNLVRFTVFTPQDQSDTSWVFGGIDLSAGVASPFPIPTLPDGGYSFPLPIATLFVGSFYQGTAGTGSQMAGQFDPVTTSTDDINLFANVANAQSATATARQAAYDAALRIENPNINSSNTIDCASCHLAQPLREFVAEPVFQFSSAGNKNAFVPDPKWITEEDIEQSTHLKPGAIMNLHAFSYKGNSPMINRRVINETAAIVTYVNSTLLRR